MPALEQMDRTDDALLWDTVSTDEYGEQKLGNPVAIKVRWEQKRRVPPPAGTEQTEAVAYDATVIMDREPSDNAILWLGTLAQWTAALASGDTDNLHKVQSKSMPKSLNGRHQRFEIKVIRYKSELNQ